LEDFARIWSPHDQAALEEWLDRLPFVTRGDAQLFLDLLDLLPEAGVGEPVAYHRRCAEGAEFRM
jgi:hypothetical protein